IGGGCWRGRPLRGRSTRRGPIAGSFRWAPLTAIDSARRRASGAGRDRPGEALHERGDAVAGFERLWRGEMVFERPVAADIAEKIELGVDRLALAAEIVDILELRHFAAMRGTTLDQRDAALLEKLGARMQVVDLALATVDLALAGDGARGRQIGRRGGRHHGRRRIDIDGSGDAARRRRHEVVGADVARRAVIAQQRYAAE